MTNCAENGGTIGIAWLSAVCNQATQYQGSVVSHYYDGTIDWSVFAHELGHTFGADHTFEEGQGSTGGIMDYSFLPNDANARFNTQYRFQEVCANMRTTQSVEHFHGTGAVSFDFVTDGCLSTASDQIVIKNVLTGNEPSMLIVGGAQVIVQWGQSDDIGEKQLFWTDGVNDQPAVEACLYTLEMRDSHGDGWNGGRVEWFVDGQYVFTSDMELDNSVENVGLLFPPGASVVGDYTYGFWESEVSLGVRVGATIIKSVTSCGQTNNCDVSFIVPATCAQPTTFFPTQQRGAAVVAPSVEGNFRLAVRAASAEALTDEYQIGGMLPPPCQTQPEDPAFGRYETDCVGLRNCPLTCGDGTSKMATCTDLAWSELTCDECKYKNEGCSSSSECCGSEGASACSRQRKRESLTCRTNTWDRPASAPTPAPAPDNNCRAAGESCKGNCCAGSTCVGKRNKVCVANLVLGALESMDPEVVEAITHVHSGSNSGSNTIVVLLAAIAVLASILSYITLRHLINKRRGSAAGPAAELAPTSTATPEEVQVEMQA